MLSYNGDDLSWRCPLMEEPSQIKNKNISATTGPILRLEPHIQNLKWRWHFVEDKIASKTEKFKMKTLGENSTLTASAHPSLPYLAIN